MYYSGFSRTELKIKAKNFIRGNYFNIFLATLLVTIPKIIYNNINRVNFTLFQSRFIIPLLLAIFVIPALEVGLISYMLKAEETDNYEVFNVFNVFISSNYLNVIKIMFLRNLYTLFWSLLFIVPGLIKSYEYSFIPYLLAQDMSLEKGKAFSLTKEYTEGEKMNMFILNLSFVGWYLLGALFFGIGAILVTSYRNVTNMKLFILLSKRNSGETV